MNRSDGAGRSALRAASAGHEGLITGRLVGHGAAPYQFRTDQNLSYYVKLQTDRGERLLSGKDLERAVKSSASHVGLGNMEAAQAAASRLLEVAPTFAVAAFAQTGLFRAQLMEALAAALREAGLP